MNQEQFLEEAINSNCCPANFKAMYTDFQHYQVAAMDTLREFHRVCEQNGVLYELAYGSLLGAIRDNGQIPWDYDIDVFVPLDEKGNLIAALDRDLDKGFYYYCPEVDKKCRHVIMRLAPKQYNTETLHVDVFFLTGVPTNEEARKRHEASIIKASRARYRKLVKVKDQSHGRITTASKLIIQKIPYLFTPEERIQKEYDAICNKYPAKDSKLLVSADSFADWYEFDSEMIYFTELISTDCGEFRIPKQYDALLKKMYGDYMKVPPLENRIREMQFHYKRLKSIK